MAWIMLVLILLSTATSRTPCIIGRDVTHAQVNIKGKLFTSGIMLVKTTARFDSEVCEDATISFPQIFCPRNAGR